MITQELVLFIKQQLQAGKSKEEIVGILTPQGWQLEDINNVFTQIMPSAQPVSAPASSVIQPTVTASPVQPMMRPMAVTMPAADATMPAQSSTGKKIIIVMVVLAILVVGGYFLAKYFKLIPDSEIVVPQNTEMVNQTIPAAPVINEPTAEPVISTSDATTTEVAPTSSATATMSSSQASENPDLSHVKDAFPVGFPMDDKDQVVRASVIAGSTPEDIRYELEYTSTHSLAYLRNGFKKSLETAGYTVSVNESDVDYRVISATKVVRKSVRNFLITLTQVGTTAHVSATLDQQ